MHAPHMKWRNDSEWWREEASLCNNGVVFILYGDFCVYVSIKTTTEDEKLACWTEEFSTTDLNSNLDFDSFRVSLLGSFGILFSSRLNSLYSNHLENHLVHTGTSLYECAHIMTSSNSTFADFISQKQICLQKLRKFAPSENFLLYEIIWLTDTVSQVLLMDCNIPDDWL